MDNGIVFSDDKKSIKMKNGYSIPSIIFGPDEVGYEPRRRHSDSFFVRGCRYAKKLTLDELEYEHVVSRAIKMGFHAIDFSAAYGDSISIGKSIVKSGVNREKLMIQTRVSNYAQFNGEKIIIKEFYNQLKGFKTDYVDVLMLHWPVTDHYEKTWEIMCKLRDKGYCRTLGVANCHEHHLNRLFEISGEYPIINQIEVHPLFTQEPLRAYCEKNGIIIEAYTSTARQDDRLMNPPLLNNLSKKYHKTKTQIILRWHIQNGIIPVFRSFNIRHLRDNCNLYDFNISDEDMDKISGMNINSRLRYDPDNCDFTRL